MRVYMMPLISQSVSTARFRGSERHQYFSSDESKRIGTITLMPVCFSLTCFSCFLREKEDVITRLCLRLCLLLCFPWYFSFCPLLILYRLMWLCFSASRLLRIFSQWVKDGQYWHHKLPLQAITPHNVSNKVLSRQNVLLRDDATCGSSSVKYKN